MKGLIIAILISIFVVSCGSNLEINGRNYRTYGLVNEGSERSPDVEYKLIWGNVFWIIVFSETIIAPVYFIGFSLMEPVGLKNDIKGK